jgi:hypothetical protein
LEKVQEREIVEKRKKIDRGCKMRKIKEKEKSEQTGQHGHANISKKD